MRIGFGISGVAVALTLAASPATAQTGGFAAPRVEAGFSGGMILGSGLFAGGYGPHVTFNLTPRAAIELHLNEYPRLESRVAARSLDGYYQVQFKWVAKGAGERTQVFVTAGVFGEYRFRRYNERQSGSQIIPAQSYNDVSRPIGLVGGVGVTHVAAKYLAFRFDAQVAHAYDAFGVRTFVGVTIPIGSYRK